MSALAAPPSPGSLELVRIDADHWVVHDHTYPQSDARRVIACVSEADNGLDVVWLSREIPLPTRYRDAADVLEDLMRWRQGSSGATRPVEIPRFRPF